MPEVKARGIRKSEQFPVISSAYFKLEAWVVMLERMLYKRMNQNVNDVYFALCDQRFQDGNAD